MRWTFSRRKLSQLLLDCALILLSTGGAFALRFATSPGAELSMRFYWEFTGTLMAIRVVCLWRWQLYRLYWRYLSSRDLVKIAKAITFSSAVYYLVRMAAGQVLYPRLAIIEWMLAVILIAGARLGYQFFHIYIASRDHEADRRPRRVLIAGAGDLGEGIAREIVRRRNGQRVVGYVDIDPSKHGALIHGVPVFGGDDKIAEVVQGREVDDVIIAIPHAHGPQIRRIVSLCENLPVRLRIFPAFDSLVARVDPKQVRDVAVEDLLGRAPVKVNLEEIASYITGERVLITGAGGSIGSELCRQVSRLSPEALCLLGHGENSIFEIEQELRSDHAIQPIPVICDVQDFERLERVFARYRPTVVFHAAAHKHVPLMEVNPEEAVKNNVVGTRNLTRLADRYGVKRFVMISTDKAVNPTSIMGASKRIGEMIIQSMAQQSSTVFAAVRFGNVLGSRGSVVPLMKRQIAKGGPVTVTHADIVRYFMTIPEAVQLVIQAGAMGKGGEIFMLDMGEPVKIMELARDLIRLSGLVPDKDIKIEVTGLRPGEKLYEELLTAQEGTSATRHEKIFIAAAARIHALELERAVVKLEVMASVGDYAGVRKGLKELIPTYTPHYPALGEITGVPEKEELPDSAATLAASEAWVSQAA